MEASTGKIIEENLVQSAFHQTLVDEFTFQQENNLKHKTKYTLEMLTKTTLNVPEWPSYSLDLNRLENLSTLENGCLVMNNNELESLCKYCTIQVFFE